VRNILNGNIPNIKYIGESLPKDKQINTKIRIK